MTDAIGWLATLATITAACMTASNLGSRITGYGFAVFTIGSVSWLILAVTTGQQALAWTNMVLTVLNLFGVWRWLGRQVKIEEGASFAAEASEETPGEALFPVSLLARAPLEDRNGSQVGTCVDAMAGCSSGRIRYIVVSEGGVAGVGERLRHLPWAEASVDGERFMMERSHFELLDEIRREEWPAN